MPRHLHLIHLWLRQEWLLVVLLVVLPLLLLLVPTAPADLAALVDWKTIGALAGLMVLSRGLEASGLIDRAGRGLVLRLRSERGLAVALVLFAAVLSAVVTNDVALFVTVPLTLALVRMVVLPVGRLVIFQALAVNAGSAASPVGNPQNLFLWQAYGAGFGEFLAGDAAAGRRDAGDPAGAGAAGLRRAATGAGETGAGACTAAAADGGVARGLSAVPAAGERGAGAAGRGQS
jgi:di/tricarboxylate transporter